MNFSLDNSIPRTVLITGASRGIGYATAKHFISLGWRVITCSRQSSDLPEHVEVDLADSVGTLEAIAAIRSRLSSGRLDALVNNAGISPKGPGGQRLGVAETDLAKWQSVFQVNFFASVLMVQGLLPQLEAAKGTVVNVTSIAGSRVHPFAGAAYATSKAALLGLTREMAADLGPKGIRVNAISPGEIDTAILSPGTDRLIEQIPLRRLGTPDEVAKAIYFLCSEQSSYLNGAEIHLNGGQHV